MENKEKQEPIEEPIKEPAEEITEEEPDEPFVDRGRQEQMSIKQLWVGTIKDIVSKVVLKLLTQTQYDDLTDGGATTLHKHDHGGMDGLDDNDHGAIYYTETEVDTALAAKANDNVVVKLSGNQTVAGIKTHSSFPVTPSSAPTTNYQVANKKYVDDNAPAIANGTVADFQAATVTESGGVDPENINDNNTGNYGDLVNINSYFTVDFGKLVQLTRFRHYGVATGQTGGKFKVQIRNMYDHTFHDWLTNIDINHTAAWSSFTTGDKIITDQVKIVVTTIPSGTNSYIAEAEVIGD